MLFINRLKLIIMNTKWIGKKVRILLHLEDHVGYKGQELTITEVLENDYVTVTDVKTEWCAGIEETDYFKY